MSGLYFLGGSILEECGVFFRTDMARLGKYGTRTGRYGQIGVCRVILGYDALSTKPVMLTWAPLIPATRWSCSQPQFIAMTADCSTT